MNTLAHHAAIAQNLASINSRVAALANSFQELAPRNAADEALIDIFSAAAADLLSAAAALKQIAYAPTPTP